MWMQIVAGVAWLIWLSSGTAGLERGLTVGALLVIGLGMKNILDTFWKRKAARWIRPRPASRRGSPDPPAPSTQAYACSYSS